MKQMKQIPIFGFLLSIFMSITLLGLTGCQSKKEDEGHTAEMHTLRGTGYFDQGNLGAGSIEGRNALAKNPEYAPALALLGNIFLEAGDAKLAIEHFTKATQLESTNSDYQLKLADSLIDGKQYNTALLHLKELGTSHPELKKQPDYSMLKGKALLHLDRLVEAKEAFNDALLLETSHAETLVGLSQTSFQEGNIAKAKTLLQQAKNAHSQNVDVLIWGAQIALFEESYQDAERYLTQALLQMSDLDIMTSKKYFALSSMVRTLVAQGKTSDALHYSDIIEKSPQGKLLADYKSAFSAMKEGKMGEAEEAFNTILNRVPGNTAAETAMGAIKYSKGDLTSAENHLLAAVGENESLTRAHKLLALTQLRLDKPNEVIKLVGNALTKSPEDPELLSIMGISYIKLKDFPEARNYLNKALKYDPKHASSRVALANLHELNNQHDKAIAMYKAIISDFPTLGIAYKNLLNAYVATTQDRTTALNKFKQATKPYLEHPTPHLLAAIAHLDLAQFDKALGVAKGAREQFPENDQIKGLLAAVYFTQARNYFGQGQFGSARKALQQSKELAPNNLALNALQIQTEIRDNKLEDALKLSIALQQSHPESAAGFDAAGKILQRKGRSKEALTNYEQAWTLNQNTQLGLLIFELKRSLGQGNAESIEHIETWYINDPEHPPSQMAAAMAWQTIGLYDKAIIEYEKLVAEQPKNALILNNLAWLRFEKEDPNALKLAKRAYDAAPNNPSIIDTYGWILLKSQKLEESLKLLQEAHKLAPNQIEIMEHLIEALKQNNKPEEAKMIQAKIDRINASKG